MICLPKLEKESKPICCCADLRVHGLVRASRENLNACAWQTWRRMHVFCQIRQEYLREWIRKRPFMMDVRYSYFWRLFRPNPESYDAACVFCLEAWRIGKKGICIAWYMLMSCLTCVSSQHDTSPIICWWVCIACYIFWWVCIQFFFFWR